jgi:hypothetical protein
LLVRQSRVPGEARSHAQGGSECLLECIVVTNAAIPPHVQATRRGQIDAKPNSWLIEPEFVAILVIAASRTDVHLDNP